MSKTFILAAAIAATTLPALADTTTLTFQDGIAGYAGTQDTMLRSADASTAYGNVDYVSVDGDDGSPGLQPNHGLLRFDNLFGSGSGQIGTGATIVSATLTLQVHNPGSGMSLYDMLAPWTEASTWSSLSGGVQTNGVEAAAAALWTIGANDTVENVGTGELVIDVTSSLRAAQAGATWTGWALLPFTNGTNGIDFYSSEYALAVDRPLLTVQVSAVPEPGNVALMLAGLALVGGSLRRRVQA